MDNKAIKPPRLHPGDAVYVTSVSSPIPSSHDLARIDQCLRGLGLEVVHGDHILAKHGYLAGTTEQRIADLNRGLRDDDIRAIVFGWGGKGASHLLPLIDYDAFRSAPKVVMGLSDPSAPINALHARTGVVTFHGPTGVNFADPVGLGTYTKDSLTTALFEVTPAGDLPSYSEWEGLRYGTASGPLVGGHLTTVQALLGTPYEPEWDGRLLFWEEVGRAPRHVDQILTHFRQRGVFDKIAGMIVGCPLECEDPKTDDVMDLRQTVKSMCADFAFPILFNVDLGHADPKLTLPIGALAEMSVESQALRLTLTESGVA